VGLYVRVSVRGSAATSLSIRTNSTPAKVPEVYIANVFGCAGGNMLPPLQWTGAPAGTKSLVVTLFDPDERSTPSGWWHWITIIPKANRHALQIKKLTS